LRTFFARIFLVVFLLSFVSPPASAADAEAIVVDVDMTDATKVSGSTLTNTAIGKIGNLTIFNSLTTSSDGFFFNDPASYLTGNLGSPTEIKKVVIEMNLKLVDTGIVDSSSGAMIFGFGSNSSSYVAYNIYHHSNFIGFNTFNSELYGITVPDMTSFHQYKFVMFKYPDSYTLQELWLDGVQQSLVYKTSAALIGIEESPTNRRFTTRSTCCNGDFTVMRHPLGPSWFSRGYMKNLRITTTTVVAAPVNTSAPSITGTKSVGQTLTSSTGTWSGPPTSYAYQWSRADTSSGIYTDISVANTSTYDLTTDDVTKFIKVGVIATNVAGSSSQTLSTATTAISAVAPSPPVINSITAGNAQLSVNFTASSNGGSAITNYEYSTNGTTYFAFSPAVTTSPLVITGLTNSTSYPVTIKAVNAINPSAASNSISATPTVTVPPTESDDSSSSSTIIATAKPVTKIKAKKPVNKIITNPFDETDVISNNAEEIVTEINPETVTPKTILIDVDPVDQALDAVYWLLFVLLALVLLIFLTNRQKFFFFLYRKKD
jgi:hypothetical protein